MSSGKEWQQITNWGKNDGKMTQKDWKDLQMVHREGENYVAGTQNYHKHGTRWRHPKTTVTEWPERVTDGWKLAQNYKKYFENEQKGTHTMLCKSFEPAVISLYFCFQGARLSVSGPVVLKTLWRFSSVFLLATFPLIFNPVQSPKYFGGLSLLSHLKLMNYEHRKAPSDFDPLCNTIW